MRRRYIAIFILGTAALCLLASLAYRLPPLHDLLAWRVDNLRVAIKRYFNPPEQVVFTPQEQVEAVLSATLTALVPALTTTPLPQLTETPFPSPIPA